MPESGLADGNARLFDEDQENAGPKSRAVNPASGPEIVGDKREQKNVRESAVNGISAGFAATDAIFSPIVTRYGSVYRQQRNCAGL